MSDRRILLWLGLALLVPSLGLVQKYAGYPGVLAYSLGVLGVAWLTPQLADTRPWRAIDERAAKVGILGILVVLGAAFAVIHPEIDATKGDANEALNYAGEELIHGRYPYGVLTQLGNVIAPLPGAVLLALPFYLLGDSAYQNFFWLGLFCLVCRHLLGSWKCTLAVLLAMVVLSPAVPHAILLGGDRIANTLFVLLFVVLLLLVAARPQISRLALWAAAALLGIGLSSRGNFLFVIPSLVPSLLHHLGRPRTFEALGVIGLTFMAVTAPFYLWDPSGFTPTHQSEKLYSPFAGGGEAALTATAILAIGLAWRSLRRGEFEVRHVLGQIAIVQAFLYAVTIGLGLNLGLQETFIFMKEGYGLQFMFFAILAGALALQALQPRARGDDPLPTEHA